MSIYRKDFPLLSRKINSNPVIYFDNASTTQKPQAVIQAVNKYYKQENSNVHRGMNPLADKATTLYEEGRATAAKFINASREEIIFTKGTTESINIIARCWALDNLKKNDTVLLSMAEHHANIVPWMQIQKQIGFKIKWIPLLNDVTIDM